jgi:hypothetical protein
LTLSTHLKLSVPGERLGSPIVASICPAPDNSSALERTAIGWQPSNEQQISKSTYNHHTNVKMAIDEETLKHYLADNPPSVVPLKIKPHFDALSDKEKLYAYYISK